MIEHLLIEQLSGEGSFRRESPYWLLPSDWPYMIIDIGWWPNILSVNILARFLEQFFPKDCFWPKDLSWTKHLSSNLIAKNFEHGWRLSRLWQGVIGQLKPLFIGQFYPTNYYFDWSCPLSLNYYSTLMCTGTLMSVLLKLLLNSCSTYKTCNTLFIVDSSCSGVKWGVEGCKYYRLMVELLRSTFSILTYLYC